MSKYNPLWEYIKQNGTEKLTFSEIQTILGFVLYYTGGCPFTAKYAPLIEDCARKNGIPFQSVRIDSREKAQAAPIAWTNYALFYNGEYVTNEILSEKKFLALAEQIV